MTTQTSFVDLSDDQLLSEIKRLAAAERCATAALVRSLVELDLRRLYLREGCSSLFTYCTQVLHLSESAAYNRIEAARGAHRFAGIVEGLEDGSLTLTAVRLLVPHLTPENHEHVLTSARHMSKREIEFFVASLHPKPAIATSIRKLPSRPRATLEPRASQDPPPAAASHPALHPFPGTEETGPARATVAPLAPERFKVQLTISRDTYHKLRRVQDLVRHTIPSGDLTEIFDRALTLLLDDLERRRLGATRSPRPPRSVVRHSRNIPAAVRREVWKRDEGRCAFLGTNGRCTERAFLEFHHVKPYAAGGPSTVENIQLRCRAHNGYEADQFFGARAPLLLRENRGPYSAVEVSRAPSRPTGPFGERKGTSRSPRRAGSGLPWLFCEPLRGWPRTVCVHDRSGAFVGERQIEHAGASLHDLASWLLSLEERAPSRVLVAIEVPHGAVIDTCSSAGSLVGTNPKQLDRFRERYSAAGARDDRRSAWVLAMPSNRTAGRRAFRAAVVDDPSIIELRRRTGHPTAPTWSIMGW